MHEENEFLMLDGVLVSITRARERERKTERERERGEGEGGRDRKRQGQITCIRRIEKFAYAEPVLRRVS